MELQAAADTVPKLLCAWMPGRRVMGCEGRYGAKCAFLWGEGGVGWGGEGRGGIYLILTPTNYQIGGHFVKTQFA